MKQNEFDKIVVCGCRYAEHHYVYTKVAPEYGDKYVYISVHLSNYSFWKRVKLAIKYIFGYKSKYGNYDTFIINKYNIKQFREIVDFVENDNNNV